VDGRDFLVWQRNSNAIVYFSAGDANHDGFVDSADLAIWQDQYGTQSPLPSTSIAIPEPTTMALVLLAGVSMLSRPFQYIGLLE
jgi:hypothetical protein